MEIEKIEIYRAIAEMAYVIAKADKGLSADEKSAFSSIVEQELELHSWIAQSRFELLDEVTQPSIDIAYNEALHDFKKYREHLTDELAAKAIRVLQKVAEACSGYSAKEKLIIDRFTDDLKNIMQQNGS
jgi:tellurite resistance protein